MIASALARTLWDSTTPSVSIPTTARMVAGYINGTFAWKSEDWGRFPDAIRVRISVKGLIPCDAYDVEQGDYLPSDTPAILTVAHDAGIARPTLYFSRDLYDEVRRYVPAPGTTWAWWCADYTGAPHRVVMADGGEASAVQYANPVYTGGNYDLSAVYDLMWPIPFSGLERETMKVISNSDGTLTVVGNAVDNGNLLVLHGKIDGPWSVEDVTQKIHDENTADARMYRVE